MKKYRVSSKKKNLLLNIIDFLGLFIFFIPKKIIPKKNTNFKKILITRLDNIWDMVLTTSFIKNIKYNYPKSEITVLCRPCQKSIIENLDFVDHIILFDAFWFGWVDWIKKLFKIIKDNYKKYDLSFELHWELLSIILNYIVSKYRVWFWIRWWFFLLEKYVFYNWNNKKNIVEHQNELIKIIWWKIKYNNLELHIDKNIKTILKEQNRKNIIIHTWVSVKSREYPIKKWIELVNKINDKYRILIVDTDLTKLEIFQKEWFETYTPKSINELIKLIYDFDLLIWVESLSSHIWASVWTKTISLYSQTTPIWLFYPYWKNLIVLRDDKCTKNECGKSNCPFWYPSKCMENIDILLIEKKINILLD